ncbi:MULTISPECIES: hypothetical protein [unclassified Arthrobacter]|uniref:hypothetical protein n=1 Tax=unclassified Arthrobacter TaxID=235627 RepID=UPI001E3D5AE0|nr:MULTISPECIES: hypothetical protein [unclassified Arthrobacter]MCC9144962.1 hypothetical protein [Arthrobacter sp. zg-Y919]MDK1276190.1 hypothetical protein [Arthrobacter sp. zg.Y919]WIB02471.1 hypothetical protein QNO10_10945 [Arthrobacter sp. zg-Y919]
MNSSLVLALAVALWLVWVGPYFLSRPPVFSASAARVRPAAKSIHPPASPDKGSQGIIMNNISNTPSGGGSTQFSTQGQQPAPQAQPAPVFRIRMGRTVLAAAGLLAVLTVVGGTLLAALTSVSWLLPAAGLAGLAAVVAALRSLALRDRRRKVENAFRAAMGPEPRQRRTAAELPTEAQAPAVPAEPQPETVLFDRESTSAPSGTAVEAKAAPRFTAEELRAEALKVAAAVHMPPRPSTTPWQPVELPKPVYVDAPKAERPAPEPIVLPETPRSLSKTPLRPATPPALPAQADQARPETGKINLDDVLQRRRA